jgi:hypothetical protein
MQIAFIQHLQLIGVLETEAEIEEIENLTRVFLNQHHQLQERFGLAFLKREVEGRILRLTFLTYSATNTKWTLQQKAMSKCY